MSSTTCKRAFAVEREGVRNRQWMRAFEAMVSFIALFLLSPRTEGGDQVVEKE